MGMLDVVGMLLIALGTILIWLGFMGFGEHSAASAAQRFFRTIKRGSSSDDSSSASSA
jgi:hypothetical protein